MSKYIDVDRLKVEIERRQEMIKSLNFGVKDDHQFVFGQLSAYKGLLSFIDSLQQEPRFPQYDNIVDKVFGAGNLDGFEYHEAEMLVALAKEELLKSLQWEHPECSSSLVDFESTSAEIKLRTCDKIEMEKLYGEEY